MNINPIDIIIILLLLGFTLSGAYSKFILSLKSTVSLIGSIFLSKIILTNLEKQFFVFFQQSELLNLFLFIILIMLSSLLIGLIANIVILQLEDPELKLIADIILGGLVGIIKGLVSISLFIFIFDSTPLTTEMKDKINSKIENESFFFKPCNNLKEMIFD
tara:strand:+ start:1503 stop:1985 length:483 start_codon:yes stop_codon:yes gene_type:complete